MIAFLQRKFALSEQGAYDLVKGCIACFIQNISLIVPIGLLYEFIKYILRDDISIKCNIYFIFSCIFCIFIIYCSTLFQYNSTYFATYKESSIRRINIAEKLRKIPLSFFGKKDLADLTSTIMADCAFLEKVFSHFIPELIASIFSTVIIGICLFIIDWRMAIAALWVIPIAFSIIILSTKVQEKLQSIQMKAKMECADGIQECIEVLRDLKSCNAEEKYLENLDLKIKNVEHRAIVSEFGMAVFMIAAGMILKLGIATVALVGSILLVDGKTDILTFFMFLLVASRLYDPLQEALQNLMGIIISRISISRTNEILNYPNQYGSAVLSNNGYDIVFKNVDFSYNNKEKVLENISFIAKQGEVTALIGPSGGGKTTVSRLAARFWDVTGGTIFIGGMDISKIEPEKLLSLFSIVFQDVTLFNNTIFENIRMGKKDATDEEVLMAAKLAYCDEIAAKLPDGWNTYIGENGSILSGGERQRISIARAFLKDAPIILLDEATASLDVENETLIQDAISKLIHDKTVLVIAHRMRTIARADKIIVLAEGKIVENGTPDQLIKKQNVYYDMLMRQVKSQEWAI